MSLATVGIGLDFLGIVLLALTDWQVDRPGGYLEIRNWLLERLDGIGLGPEFGKPGSWAEEITSVFRGFAWFLLALGFALQFIASYLNS